MFPLKSTLGKYGNREYYGAMPTRPENTEEGQLTFQNGDITYCPANNTIAVVYNLNDALTDRLRELIALVVLTANQDKCGLAAHTKAVLNIGVTPVEIKEAVYQCSPYMGTSKVTSALETVNTVFSENNIELPLCRQSTVTENTRYAKGLDIQVNFFGDGMRNAHVNAPDGQKHISDYLSAMCFGDFYTRNGLDLKDRELLTFCMLSVMGGCEPQVKAHVTGNLNAGNNKETLIAAITQALPYIGYPRTLNAIACINEICNFFSENIKYGNFREIYENFTPNIETVFILFGVIFANYFLELCK